jgi:hypothetical protein
LVENSGFGGTIAAPIAQQLLMKYFYPSAKQSGDSLLLDSTKKKEQNLSPNSKVITSNQ